MDLITAAMADELQVALDLCIRKEKIRFGAATILKGVRNGREFFFYKTGVGPKRSAAKLELLFQNVRPTNVLGIGYAGALSDSLKLGDLTIVRKASLLAEAASTGDGIRDLMITGSWELADSEGLRVLGGIDGAPVRTIDILTSPFILGDPEQKSVLGRRFHALAVDMETAAIARVCVQQGIRFTCVRAISDEVGDSLLAPFSYEPSAGPIVRALKVASAGHWLKRMRKWRENASAAKRSLKIFLKTYLDSQATNKIPT